jgi:hypothetical protein
MILKQMRPYFKHLQTRNVSGCCPLVSAISPYLTAETEPFA